MKHQMDHHEGQRRAEIFEELLGALLSRKFSQEHVDQNALLPPAKVQKQVRHVDFLVASEEGSVTLVEAKAPYRESPDIALDRAVTYLEKAAAQLLPSRTIESVIVAITGVVSASARARATSAAFFSSRNIRVEIWDQPILLREIKQQLNLNLPSFSPEDMTVVHGELRAKAVKPGEEQPSRPTGPDVPPWLDCKPQQPQQVVAVCADFRSYSAFVKESAGDNDLVTSVMGRFYRETRRLVNDADGFVDKFMGDAVLAFWELDSSVTRLASRLDDCVTKLIGNSVNLAQEWQEMIDSPIEEKGMRVGSALGPVLIIPEGNGNEGPRHVVGDCINKAARLQSKAATNSMRISNHLKTAVFPEDIDFKSVPEEEYRNIGPLITWEKQY